jgi:hypothetical protein
VVRAAQLLQSFILALDCGFLYQNMDFRHSTYSDVY